MASKKETVLFATYKKWLFSSDVEAEFVEGKVICAVCKYYPEVEYSSFMCEARIRNIRGSALTSVENFRNPVTYIHRSTLPRHVGTKSSFQNWSKSKVAPNDAVVSEITVPTSSKNTQPTVSESFLHYTKLFRSVLFLLEEELAFIKVKTYCRTRES